MPAQPCPLHLALGGIIALAAAMGIGRFVYTPILPFMTEAIPLTKAEAGLIASANFAGYLIGALLTATPYLRGSRWKWMIGGLVASALTTMLSGAPSGVLALSLVRFAAGVASALVLVYASSVILERLTAAGSVHLSTAHFAGVGIGIALSAATVSLLAEFNVGWRGQWLVTGAIALLAVPAVAFFVPPQPQATGRAASAGALTFTPRLTAIVAAYGLFGFGYVITATFLVAIVRGSPEIRHLEPVIWIAVGLSGVPSVALWSLLAARIGYFWVFTITCLVEALGVALSVLTTSTFGLLFAAACLGGTFMAITAVGLLGARTLSTSDPGRMIAAMTAAFGVGQIVGPFFGGLLSDLTGSFTLPSLLAAAALLVAALLSAGVELSLAKNPTALRNGSAPAARRSP
jgi:predicted MFS family arabinose efflux permease